MLYNFEIKGNYLTIYHTDNSSYMSTILQDNHITFFKNLLANLDDKEYNDGKTDEIWSYWDQTLTYSVNAGDDQFGICINDHEFIKILCEKITKI